MYTHKIFSIFIELKFINRQFKIIQDAAHIANIEQPEQFNDALLNFLLPLIK